MNNVRKFRRKPYQGLKKLILACLLLGIGYLLIFHVFRVNKIIIVGTDRYNEEQMMNYLITDTLDHNTLCLLFKYKYKEQPDIPFVETIDVKYVNQNTIEVQVYEKVVTGCIQFLGEYLYFDKDGIVVESSSLREDDVPLIIGLNFQRIALHEEIKIQKQSLFDTILNLTKLIHEYEIDVDTISFDSNYEVTLTCGKSKVLLGKHDFYDVPISQLPNILAASKDVAYSYNMKNYTKVGQEFIAEKLE